MAVFHPLQGKRFYIIKLYGENRELLDAFVIDTVLTGATFEAPGLPVAEVVVEEVK